MSAFVRTICSLLQKLSVHLQRSAVWNQNLKGVRKLSVHLQRSAVWGLTPKTVHKTAEVFSLSYTSVIPICSLLRKLSVHLQRSAVLFQNLKNVAATPKTVRPPAKVCSLRDCPSTCRCLQVEPQLLLWLKLRRSAVVRTVSQTARLCRGYQVEFVQNYPPNITKQGLTNQKFVTD